jgi:hypothetical protein
MGVYATITVVPRSEIRKKRRSPDLAQFELYKEWWELQPALDEIGGLAGKALRGRSLIPDGEDADCQFSLVSPTMVKRISKALGAVSDDALLATIHKQRRKTGWRLRKYEHGEKLEAFKTLKDAYRLAARKDAYVEVFIG